MGIKLSQKGDFSKVTGFFEQTREVFKLGILDKYGRMGVEALSSATPKDTGLTSESWYYKIEQDLDGKSASLIFGNKNIQNGIPIAIILEYGHGTRNGGWVQGRKYIDPVIQPIFDELAEKVWKEVKG